MTRLKPFLAFAGWGGTFGVQRMDASPALVSACLTSVQPSETSPKPLRKTDAPEADVLGGEPRRGPWGDTRAQIFMHGNRRPVRTFVIAALDSDPEAKMVRRVRRLEQCCVAPLYAAKSDGKVGLIPGFCRDRMCPTCQYHRGREVAARVEGAVLTMNAPRFLTLTLRHRTERLHAMLDRLYKAFRELRQTEAWKTHVCGGIGTLEVTLSKADDCWHAHLHLLIDGVFWPHASIKAEWLRVTGDSEIVHVEAVHDRRNAAKYVSTYIGKPAEVFGWADSVLCEYARAMAGRRLVVTFGTLYRAVKATDDCETRPTLVEPLASVPALLRACGRGCVYGLEARRLLGLSGGLPARAAGFAREPGAPEAPPLKPHDWQTLIVCLRRVAGDGSAWLPEFEPRRKFDGRTNAGRKRPDCSLRLFNDTGNATPQARQRPPRSHASPVPKRPGDPGESKAI